MPRGDDAQLALLPRSNGWAPFSTRNALEDGQACFHILSFPFLSLL
jgi:hypothetical protein